MIPRCRHRNANGYGRADATSPDPDCPAALAATACPTSVFSARAHRSSRAAERSTRCPSTARSLAALHPHAARATQPASNRSQLCSPGHAAWLRHLHPRAEHLRQRRRVRSHADLPNAPVRLRGRDRLRARLRNQQPLPHREHVLGQALSADGVRHRCCVPSGVRLCERRLRASQLHRRSPVPRWLLRLGSLPGGLGRVPRSCALS